MISEANLWSEATAWNEFVTSVKQWIIMNNDGCFSSSQILYFDVSVTKSDRIVIDALFRQMLIHYQKHKILKFQIVHFLSEQI